MSQFESNAKKTCARPADVDEGLPAKRRQPSCSPPSHRGSFKFPSNCFSNCLTGRLDIKLDNKRKRTPSSPLVTAFFLWPSYYPGRPGVVKLISTLSRRGVLADVRRCRSNQIPDLFKRALGSRRSSGSGTRRGGPGRMTARRSQTSNL
ncbi:hypothetical protein K488DRAFT_74185 [Vararia minispora EC-137]|uniref:Uncharacterized protein n=1 Tax=Vararia minispora EC-137 TaxID=1314806 RepID=A0ACB8Q852_9AGAM|nr:hypothetical protein K488DRAFT_74185 [Vararia minispora EC-137]